MINNASVMALASYVGGGFAAALICILSGQIFEAGGLHPSRPGAGRCMTEVVALAMLLEPAAVLLLSYFPQMLRTRLSATAV
jgi:hypothetical protein